MTDEWFVQGYLLKCAQHVEALRLKVREHKEEPAASHNVMKALSQDLKVQVFSNADPAT